MTKAKQTRQDLLSRINGAGLDMAALCKKEGEVLAQPSKAFLIRIVEKYNLAGVVASKKDDGIIKYISQTAVGSKSAPETSVSNVAESIGTQQDLETEEEEEFELLLNQVTGLASPVFFLDFGCLETICYKWKNKLVLTCRPANISDSIFVCYILFFRN